MAGADETRGPFTGVHLPWSEAPAAVRSWVERTAGSPVVSSFDAAGGFSPGCCAVLRFENGGSAFVKAVGEALNPVSPTMHRREARVAAALPSSPQLPRLLDAFDDGGWVALLFEEVPGRLPRHPWAADELDAVLDGLAELHEALTPCPIPDIEVTSVRERSLLTGWRTLAEMDGPPAGLDEWSRRHLDRLAALEEVCLAAVDDGDTLVHGDVRSDNVLLEGSSATFVDWPHASRGAPVRDLVGWAPSVALEGGPDPETLFRRFRFATDVDHDAVTAMVAGIAGFFTAHALRPPEPGLPTLRTFQAAQGRVARAWLRQRNGWS